MNRSLKSNVWYDDTVGHRIAALKGWETRRIRSIQKQPKTKESKVYVQGLPIKISPDDVSYPLAVSAYMGISFTPEQRAKQEQNDYVQHIKSVYDKLTTLVNTEEKKETLKNELKSYRDEYLKRLNALLNAKSRIVSVMISGPSKFPTARMQKRSETENKRLRELIDWSEKTINKIRTKLKGEEAIRTEDPEAITKLEKKIESAKKLQEVMKESNKIIKSKGLSDKEKIIKLAKLTKVSEQEVSKLLKPDFTGQIGFSDYKIRNNLANIKRMEVRLKEISQKKSQTSKEIKFDGGYIIDNVEENRLQIFFDRKPSDEVRDKLKRNGFKWAPSVGAWQRHRSNQANYYAQEITGVKISNPIKGSLKGNPINLKLHHCSQADKEHNHSKRQYAHVGHYKGIICVADAFFDLPHEHYCAILIHEIGHLMGGKTEAKANQLIKKKYGVKMQYKNSKYGDKLEYLPRNEIQKVLRIAK